MQLIVVTGSTADPLLRRCILSLAASRDPGCAVEHWIVADGEAYAHGTQALVDQCPPPPPWLTRRVIVLPHNTGKDGGTYLCHRVIAACAYMVPNTSWMSVLDQDNEVHDHHLQAVRHCIEQAPTNARWGWTLRSIIDKDTGTVQCVDTVESMGNVRCTCLGNADRLIDTNCFVFRADLLRELAPLWGTTPARQEGVMEADRKVCHTLLAHEPTSWCTRDWTVKYRVDGRDSSVSLDFFRRHARVCRPWDPTKKDVYILHFDKQRTDAVLRRQAHSPLDEWCMTMYDALDDGYNLINGFDSLMGLPHDAVVFMAMCHPDTLPLDELRQLKQSTHPQMTRVLYTAEGPNIRHAAQWRHAFVSQAADVVLTFCKDTMTMLEASGTRCIPTPHNARFVTDPRVCRTNLGDQSGTICMVLEPRPGCETYDIDGTARTQLDGLRAALVDGLGKTGFVAGRGWTQACAGMTEPPTVLVDVPNRMQDTNHAVDYYQKHDLALIVENCDSPGYVSEKVGDALMAGAIPLYWGSNVDDDPVASDMFRRGKNVWWIDLRDVVGTSDVQEVCSAHLVGRCIREYISHKVDVEEMKRQVLAIRHEYLLERGSNAIRRAVDALYQ
jgi:hypothetical protein